MLEDTSSAYEFSGTVFQLSTSANIEKSIPTFQKVKNNVEDRCFFFSSAPEVPPFVAVEGHHRWEPRHRGRRERPGAIALRLACSSSSQELATRVPTDKSCRPCNDFLMSPAFAGAVVERVYEHIFGILPDADRVVSIQIFLGQLQHLQADDIVNILPKQAVDKVEAVHGMLSTFLSRDEPGVDAASAEDLCKLVFMGADFFCRLVRGNDGFRRAQAAVAEYNRILAIIMGEEKRSSAESDLACSGVQMAARPGPPGRSSLTWSKTRVALCAKMPTAQSRRHCFGRGQRPAHRGRNPGQKTSKYFG